MSPRARQALQALALAAMVFGAYVPAIRGGFVWDDIDLYIIENPLLRLPDGLYRFWFTPEPADYYPLAYTTFWFEWRLWSDNPTGYHVVNLLLHAGVSIVLWRLMRAMQLPGAWLAAAVFSVHPVNVETAAWIAQRKALLGGLFGFWAWLSYIRFDERRAWRYYAASLALFFLSLSGKPILIMLPLVLLGWRWWAGRAITLRNTLHLLPYFALSLLMGAVGTWFQYMRALGGGSVRDEGLAARIAASGWAAWFYVYKALLPIDLCFVYPRWEIDPSRVVVYLPLLAAFALLVAAWRCRRSWGRPVLAAWGFFLLTMLPSLGLVDVYFWRYSLVGDHYQYQSIIAVIVAGVAAGAWCLRRLNGKGASVVLSALLLTTLGVLTFRQSRMYRDEEFVWRDTIARNPGAWMPRNNLGNMLFRRKQFAEAVPFYLEALAAHPDDAQTHSNLASALASLNRVEEAAAHWAAAVRLNKEFPEARRNLAIAYEKLKRFDDAQRTWEAILADHPDHAEARERIARNILRPG